MFILCNPSVSPTIWHPKPRIILILKMMLSRSVLSLSVSSHFLLKYLHFALLCFALNVKLSNGGFDVKKKSEYGCWQMLAWKHKSRTLKIEPLAVELEHYIFRTTVWGVSVLAPSLCNIFLCYSPAFLWLCETFIQTVQQILISVQITGKI